MKSRPEILAVATAIVMFGSSANAAPIVVINNGLAPPNPANVIDAINSFPDEIVFVRNVGCGDPPDLPFGACSDPGPPTTIAVEEGGVVDEVHVFDTSIVEVNGGEVSERLSIRGQGPVTITGGSVADALWAGGGTESSLDINGGYVDIVHPNGATEITVNGGTVGKIECCARYTPVNVRGGEVRGIKAGPAGVIVSGEALVNSLDVGTTGTSGWALVEGGLITGRVLAYRESTLAISGGSLTGLELAVVDTASISVLGGTLETDLIALESGTIEIFGTGFAVDGDPVGPGLIPEMSGVLTGTLRSGEPISAQFFHNGAVVPRPFNPIATGKIFLTPEPTPACIDSVDNDEDGLIDYPNDPGCTDALDLSEAPDCEDGFDNDGDGVTDYPDDLGCADADDLSERSPLLHCDDGADNDGDGGMDFDPVTYADPGDETALPSGQGDPGCISPSWNTESPQCQDGIDNDGDGKID